MNLLLLLAFAGFFLLLAVSAVLLVLPIRLKEFPFVWRASFWIAGGFCTLGALWLGIFFLGTVGKLGPDVMLTVLLVIILGTLLVASLMFLLVPLRVFYLRSMLRLAESVGNRRDRK